MSSIPAQPTRPAPPSAGTSIRWIARILAAGIFLYTGVKKIEEPATFAKEIRGYGMVPLELTNAMALYLPWLEVLTAGLILIPWFRREARLLIMLMLVVFTIAKAAALLQGLKIHCGCVPATSPLRFLFDGWPGVMTNLVLLTLLVVDWATDRRRRLSVAQETPTSAA